MGAANPQPVTGHGQHAAWRAVALGRDASPPISSTLAELRFQHGQPPLDITGGYGMWIGHFAAPFAPIMWLGSPSQHQRNTSQHRRAGDQQPGSDWLGQKSHAAKRNKRRQRELYRGGMKDRQVANRKIPDDVAKSGRDFHPR